MRTVTLAEYEAIMLDPEFIDLRARAVAGDLDACRDFVHQRPEAEQPKMPPAPAVVWVVRPPELRGRDISVNEVPHWHRPVVRVSGILFRRNSGRRIKGSASRNGRLNYTESMRVFNEHWREVARVQAVFADALRRIDEAHGEAVIARLGERVTHTTTKRGGQPVRLLDRGEDIVVFSSSSWWTCVRREDARRWYALP